MIYFFRWFLCSFTAGVVAAELVLLPILGDSIYGRVHMWWAGRPPYALRGTDVIMVAAQCGAAAGLVGIFVGAVLYLKRAAAQG